MGKKWGKGMETEEVKYSVMENSGLNRRVSIGSIEPWHTKI